MAKEPNAEREDKYKRVTQAQFDIWAKNRVTRNFLQCLGFNRLDVRDKAGDGSLVDPTNADLTLANIHNSVGQQEALKVAEQPHDLLVFYEMIEVPEPEPDEETKEDD